MMKKISNIINELSLDWWIYGFLIIFIIIVIICRLNEWYSTILAIFLVSCIYSIYYYKDKRKKQKYLKMKIQEIDKIDKQELINLIKLYYENLKYKVEIKNNMKIYDLELQIRRNERVYTVIGSKSEKQIDVDMIQQIINLKRNYNAESFVFVSNNYYSKMAWKLAKQNRIYLIDRNKLIDIYYQFVANKK